ncbi:MAG: D-2-hydroxyacid dehydrogenase [Bacteroidota bacterium]
MKIVVLDGHTLNPGDLDWTSLEALGEVTIYPRTKSAETHQRAQAADILVVNKHLLDADLLAKLPQLKLVAVTATGFNNVDVTAAAEHGIPVCNVSGYSTPAVAQHVFALLTHFTNQVAAHNASVQAGDWSRSPDFAYTLDTITELTALRLGIYGLGRIGQAVARVGQALGMDVWAHHKHPKRDAMDGVTFVDLPTLFAKCNVVSLHAPLSASNHEIVNYALLKTMPAPSYLINTGRGGLIHEKDLARALQEGMLTGAALDVLSSEPPPADHPLIGVPNCIITPHVAWASQSARNRLLAETVQNIEAFQTGKLRNRVN